MDSDPTPLVAPLVFGLPLTAIAGILAFRSTVAGLGLVLSSAVVSALLLGQPHLFQVGISVTYADAIHLILAAAAVGRLLGSLSTYPLPLSWILFVLLLLASFVLGISELGTPAGVAFRDHAYLLICSVYFAFSVSPKEISGPLQRAFVVGGAVIALVVLYRWAAPSASIGFAVAMDDGLEGRVVPASSAFVVLVGAIVLVHQWLVDGISYRKCALLWLMLLVAVGARHRTVWVAAMSGLTWFLMIRQPYRRKLFWYALGSVFVGSIGALALSQVGVGPFDSIAARFGEFGSASSGTGTFQDRYLGWIELLSQFGQWRFLDQLLGQPFGTGFERTILVEGEYRFIEWSPHSFYVEILLRGGALGLLFFLATIGLVLVRLLRVRGPHAGAAQLLAVLTVVGSVYALTYRVPETFGVIVGCGFALLGFRVKRATPSKEDPHGRHRPAYLPQPTREDATMPGIPAR